MKRLFYFIRNLINDCIDHRLNASAAHAAYFIMLSFIPSMILLLSLIQFTSIDKIDVIQFVQTLVPSGMKSFVTGVINEAYTKTSTTVSISALAAVWSAGKGMMALTQGLQTIYGVDEKRNYLMLRFRSAGYTVALVLAVILFLIAGVFGNILSEFLVRRIPWIAFAVEIFQEFRTGMLLLVATVLFVLIYHFIPGKQKSFSAHVPGGVFASIGWFVFSWGISKYVERFKGFSNMYGSLTTIILVMLWMYFGMYIILIGAEINRQLQEPEKSAEAEE